MPRHKDKQTGAPGHVETDLDHWSKKFLTLPVPLPLESGGSSRTCHICTTVRRTAAPDRKAPRSDETGGARCDHSIRSQMEISHTVCTAKHEMEAWSCDCLVWSWKGHQKNLLLLISSVTDTQVSLHDRTSAHRDLDLFLINCLTERVLTIICPRTFGPCPAIYSKTIDSW